MEEAPFNINKVGTVLWDTLYIDEIDAFFILRLWALILNIHPSLIKDLRLEETIVVLIVKLTYLHYNLGLLQINFNKAIVEFNLKLFRRIIRNIKGISNTSFISQLCQF